MVRGDILLFPDLSGKASSFSPLRMMLAIDFLWLFCINLRKFPSSPSFLKDFIMNGCWFLSSNFSAPVNMIFRLLMQWITSIAFQMLNQLCILRINTTWLWWIILFIHCWRIWFANVLLRIFTPIFMREFGPEFSFLVMSFSSVAIRVMLASQNELERIISDAIFGRRLYRGGIIFP